MSIEPAPRSESRTLFLQFVALPVLIVVPILLVLLAFSHLAYEGRSCAEDLADLRRGSAATPNARWQAAYSVAQSIRPGGPCRGEIRAADLAAAYDGAGDDDPRVRRFLVLAIGLLGDRAAGPALLDALESRDPETRIYAIEALGALGDPATRERLEALLADPADPGLRKAAAYALGNAGPDAAPALRRALEDPVSDVRWNAALALARLGDSSGAGVVAELLDRAAIGRARTADGGPVSSAQIEAAMIEGLKAAVVLRSRDLLPRVREIAENDPSMRVRSAALEAAAALEAS